MLDFKTKQIKFWFQNQRRIAKSSGNSTAKPLRSLIHHKRSAEKTNFKQTSNFYNCANELEPPTKERAIESSGVAWAPIND